MKTVEITRHKQAVGGAPPDSTFKVFMDIYRREGIAGINKGVNAVALRQATNWGSRIGGARLVETAIRSIKGVREGEKLGAVDRIMAGAIGGGLSTWNQPIEVVRVEVGFTQRRELMSDAICAEIHGSYSTCEEDGAQHAELYLPDKWRQRSV